MKPEIDTIDQIGHIVRPVFLQGSIDRLDRHQIIIPSFECFHFRLGVLHLSLNTKQVREEREQRWLGSAEMTHFRHAFLHVLLFLDTFDLGHLLLNDAQFLFGLFTFTLILMIGFHRLNKQA